MRFAPAIVALACLGAPLAAADTPAPAPAPAAPAAPTELGGKPQPEVNQGFLEKAEAAAGVIAQACEATGVTGKLGAKFGVGGSSSSAGNDDKAKLATGLKNDLQSLHDGKKVASDGAFSQLVLSGKDAISTKFKGVKGADTLQAAFADGGIGKALVDATPVDKVPGYKASVDALTSLTPAK
jgi:hypothetical protein